jgi:hypothetical protein
MLDPKLPKCVEFTALLRSVARDFVDVDSALLRFEPASGIGSKQKIDRLQTKFRFPYSAEIFHRMLLAEKYSLYCFPPKRLSNGAVLLEVIEDTRLVSKLVSKSGEVLRVWSQGAVKVEDFHHGLALVEIDYAPSGSKLYNFIDEKGEDLLLDKVSLASDFSQGLALIKESSFSSYFIDTDGQKLAKNEFSGIKFAHPFGNGVSFVHKDNERFFIDLEGRRLTDEQLGLTKEIRTAKTFYENRLLVTYMGSTDHFFVDENFRDVSGPYMNAHHFHENRAWVRINQGFTENPWVMIDRDGAVIWSHSIEEPGNFSSGYALVKNRGDKVQYFLNKNGNQAFAQYTADTKKGEALTPFVDGVASYISAEGTIYFDTMGNIVAEETGY